jgi:predicted deacetylase
MQRVVVAIHDVAPSRVEEVRYLLRRLDTMGVERRVLKVIPAADGGLERHPELLALLREEVAKGSETLVHGYTHRVAGRLRGPLRRRIRGRLFAPAASEFLSLDPEEGRARLLAGRAHLLEAGLKADGFCAPAWLEPRWLERACVEAGFRYLVRMAWLRSLGSRRRRLTPWFGYMGAPPGQERLVTLANLALLRVAGRLPLIKIFLHPSNAPSSPDCERVLRTIPRLCAGREVCTYGQLA